MVSNLTWVQSPTGCKSRAPVTNDKVMYRVCRPSLTIAPVSLCDKYTN